MVATVEPYDVPVEQMSDPRPGVAASLGPAQMNVEVAVAELRAGRAIGLRHRGGYTLVASAHLATEPFVEYLEELAGSPVSVALPRDEHEPAAGTREADARSIATAAARAHAIQDLLLHPARSPRPGLLTVAADPAGVLKRGGAAEGALDLMRLAQLGTAAIIADIIVTPAATKRLREGGVGFVCISDVAAHRGGLDAPVERVISVGLPTLHGHFDAIGYRAPLQGMEFIAAVRGDYAGAENVPVSVHEGCVLGDALRTSGCACGPRFEVALEHLGRRPTGIVIRLEADWTLLFGDHPPPDPCRTALAIQVIRDLGPASVVLVDTDAALAASLIEQGCPVGH